MRRQLISCPLFRLVYMYMFEQEHAGNSRHSPAFHFSGCLWAMNASTLWKKSDPAGAGPRVAMATFASCAATDMSRKCCGDTSVAAAAVVACLPVFQNSFLFFVRWRRLQVRRGVNWRLFDHAVFDPEDGAYGASSDLKKVTFDASSTFRDK